MAKRWFSNWWAELALSAAAGLAFLLLGAYLTLVRQYLPGDAMSRFVSAYLVFYGAIPKLATIGFVWPPVPTLLLLPLAWIPWMADTWLAPVFVSALAMAVAVFLLGRLMRTCGLTRGWRLLFMFLFASNPMIFAFGANGMSEAILIAATCAACYWLIRFWTTRRNTTLILSATFFGVLPIIRYEAIVLTACAGLLIAYLSWEWEGHLPQEQFASLMEGRMLAYGSLAIYPLFLWMVGSWQIMGNPLYFLVNERSALSVAIYQIVNMGIYDTSLSASLGLTFGLWFGLFPLAVVALLAALWLSIRRRNPFLVGLALLPLVLPLLQGLLLNRQTTVPLLRYYIMVVPLAVVVLAAVWYVYTSPSTLPVSKRTLWARNLLLGLVALVFLASNGATAYALSTSPFESSEGETWQELGFPVLRRVPYVHVPEAIAVGRMLPEKVPAGSRILVDTHGRGYAVVLGSRQPLLFLNHTDPHYDEAILSPWKWVDYVLIPDPGNEQVEGALDAINEAHPGLWEFGETWAVQVEGLPKTAAGWRLYKIIR